MSDDFDWDDLEPHEDVLGHQPRTCVYENTRNAVVIRQEAGLLSEEDSYVYIRPENLPALIAALSRYLPARAGDDHAEHTYRPMTAAERKRAQRARQRHEVTTDVTLTVTKSHETTVTRRDVSRDERDTCEPFAAPRLGPTLEDLFPEPRRAVFAPG